MTTPPRRRGAASRVLATALPFALAVPLGLAVAVPASAADTPPRAVLLATRPTITSAPPLRVVLGQPFSHTFTATGDPAPRWSVTGTLPPGLTLDPVTGVLSGVPTATVALSLATVTATNSAGSASQAVTLATVLPGTPAPAPGAAPVITSAPPVAVVLATPYRHQFTATGTPTSTWSVTSGTLPAGLTLDPVSGVLSGTPSAIGTSVFTVTARNSAGSAAQTATLVVVGSSSAPSITPPPTVVATVGVPFAYEASATGVPRPTWSVEGALPAGVRIDAATGVVTGTPTAPGTSTVTLVATNSVGSDREPLTLVVAAAGSAPVTDATRTVVGTVGAPLRTTLTASGTPTWALTAGALPAGLTLDAATGTISGIPTVAGTTVATVSATTTVGVTPVEVTFVVFPVQLATTPPAGTARWAGADRMGTAVDVSRKLFPQPASARAVVLTTSEKYADALAGGRLASANGGPLLLTPSASLSADVAAEVSRVLAPGGTVFVLGGETTLTPQVAASVAALPGGYRVQRLAGADRFATAAAIATEVRGVSGGTTGPVYLVNGQNFPDGLAVSALAARTGGVVMLTDGAALPTVTRAYLQANDPTGTQTVPVGGQAEVAAGELPTATARAAVAQALVGADRYDTARLVAAEFESGSGVPVVAAGLATGENWPDALVGAAALGALNSPLLLTPRVQLDPATQAAMAGLNAVSPVSVGLVFGGEPSLSAGTMASFAALVPAPATGTTP
ncbi:cell wall-binding repeat-containing protein [Kineococcus sp. NPDC059986]|uniref:cell wall-binding repeat-containing protein n=1 Tax=Kineococcus sp. NPDC059986 TaxID=3155538 RepID=UPI0034503B96